MENDWTKVLGFSGYRVYKQEIDERHKRLTLWIRRKRGNRSMTCAGCGRRVHKIHEVYEREIRDLPCFEFETTVVVELYRVDRPELLRRSPRMTHFCSVRVTHTKNTIWRSCKERDQRYHPRRRRAGWVSIIRADGA
jgi:transposase